MTIQELLQELNVRGETLRAVLREFYPEDAPGRGGDYVLDSKKIEKLRIIVRVVRL